MRFILFFSFPEGYRLLGLVSQASSQPRWACWGILRRKLFFRVALSKHKNSQKNRYILRRSDRDKRQKDACK